MGLRRSDPLLVALLISGVLAISWGFIGTTDLEEQFNGAFSYAASYRNTFFSGAPEFGKHTFLGIPVYDTSVGMGYQIPFLYGVNHSPFIILRYFFPTQIIQFISVIVASLFALTNLNHMYKSWSNAGSRWSQITILVLLDFGVMGPAVFYLFINEWSTQAAQYFGAVAISSLLFERTWFCQQQTSPLKIQRFKITITMGIVFLFLGHQGNIPNFLVLVLVPLSAHLYSRKISWKDQKTLFFFFIVFIAAFLPNVLDVIIESAKQPFARITAINWYTFSLSAQGIWQFLHQLLSSNSWPVSFLLKLEIPKNIEESTNGFFGLISIVVAVVGLKFIKRSRPFLVAILQLIICCPFIALQSLTQDRLGPFASSAAWQLRDTLLIISTLMIALFAANIQTHAISRRASTTLQAGVFLAMFFSAIFPIGIVGTQARSSGYSNGVILKVFQDENTEWIRNLHAAGVKEGDRIYIANPDLFRFADWLGYEKLPQFVDLGVSTINGWPKIRAAFTLAKNQAGFEARFYNLIDSRFGCRPHELDFLAVDWVLDSNGECQEEYLREFSKKNLKIYRVGENKGLNQTNNVYLYRISKTKVYKVDTSIPVTNDAMCALLMEDNCLSKTGARSEEIGKEYFRFCLRKCVANIEWYSDEPGSSILVPLDFQSFFRIENTRTKQELRASTTNGILRIEKDIDTRTGDTITIFMKPNPIMIISVLSTWTLIIAVLSVLLILPIERLYRNFFKQ